MSCTRLNRIQFYITNIFLGWLVLFGIRNKFPSYIGDIVTYLPLILIASFVLYLSAATIYSILQIRDCEGESKELKKDIEHAKKELTKLGIMVDGLFVVSQDHHRKK
eukprot:GHVP01045759.1.p1 GENE.GHVP01045759.1~~GHVP01045759.1.p1  ORF type:complete len:107 (+),score=15.74 GHVP01045759.1:3-323(+)